jgi:hypothetical protein
VPAFSGHHNSCGEANYCDGNNDKRGFHIRQPAVTVGRFEDMPQRYDFMVQRPAGCPEW